MPRQESIFMALAFWGLVAPGQTCIRAQETLAGPASETRPKEGIASLKISLRLQDGAPFLGAVNVRLMPDEGYEMVGVRDQTTGDFLFPDIEPGKYIVEVAAPGYLEARLKAQVDGGHRQKTMTVLMKPRQMPKDLE